MLVSPLTPPLLHLLRFIYLHFLKLIFTGVQLFYNVVLVSVEQQNESAIYRLLFLNQSFF